MSNLLIPTVVESTALGERAYDIYSRLLRDRIVFVGGQIDDEAANTDVATICAGFAASAASVLLVGGALGKRFALPYSKISSRPVASLPSSTRRERKSRSKRF